MYIEKLSLSNINRAKEIYEDFKIKAFGDYHIEIPLMEFQDFVSCISQGVLEGFILFKQDTACAILLYTIALNEAIELNVIHLKEEDIEQRKFLFETFLNYVKENKYNRPISYPMFGPQACFVEEINNYGFDFSQQCIMKQRFTPDVIDEILAQGKTPLPQGVEVIQWDNNYIVDVVKIIQEGFKDSNDAKFDARYQTEEGVKDILFKILDQTYGIFLPDATSILLIDGKVEGVCLVNLTDIEIANIPILAVSPSQKEKGFGKSLLRDSIFLLANLIKNDNLLENVKEINASTDKSNFPAIKTYEKCGFVLDYSYPHAFKKL